jgi:hypothetical protein
VLDAALIADRVVLVLDWTELREREGGFGQIQNLRAYTTDGRHEWTAQHPTNSTADCYTNMISSEPLVVGNYAGFD